LTDSALRVSLRLRRAVLLFPNFFAACKGFLWNLESGILDVAIRPRRTTISEFLRSLQRTSLESLIWNFGCGHQAAPYYYFRISSQPQRTSLESLIWNFECGHQAALLFPNFFTARKGFLWNLESGILNAAIRPRRTTISEFLRSPQRTSLES
jgi:hypothetical protein